MSASLAVGRGAPSQKITMKTLRSWLCYMGIILGSVHIVFAFNPSTISTSSAISLKAVRQDSKLPVSISSNECENEGSAVLSDAEVRPLIRLNKESAKEKIVNAYGIWTLLVSLVTCPIWLLAMKIIDAVNKLNKELDPNKEIYDGTGKIWSKFWLFLSGCYPTITGDVEQITKERGACLYVANHSSWLDIPLVCTMLHPVFKFVSKGELRSLPCIGDQLVGGNHVLLDREDRRSQLRMFKESIGWLKKGVPLMAFPEGQRSLDGRLLKFKGGTFAMATKCNVPIVPITISNAHAVMPANALFPVQHGGDKLNIHVHPAIDVEGKKDDEIADLVRSAIISKLPMDQRPLPNDKSLDVIKENKQEYTTNESG